MVNLKGKLGKIITLYIGNLSPDGNEIIASKPVYIYGGRVMTRKFGNGGFHYFLKTSSGIELPLERLRGHGYDDEERVHKGVRGIENGIRLAMDIENLREEQRNILNDRRIIEYIPSRAFANPGGARRRARRYGTRV